MVKYELAFEFVEFYILAVEFGADVRLPVFGDLGKLFRDVHFCDGVIHGILAQSVFWNRWRITPQGSRKINGVKNPGSAVPGGCPSLRRRDALGTAGEMPALLVDR